MNTAAGTHCARTHSSQGGFPSKSGSMVQSPIVLNNNNNNNMVQSSPPLSDASLRPTSSDVTRVDCSGKCKLSRATSMTNPRSAIWCHQALIYTATPGTLHQLYLRRGGLVGNTCVLQHSSLCVRTLHHIAATKIQFRDKNRDSTVKIDKRRRRWQ